MKFALIFHKINTGNVNILMRFGILCGTAGKGLLHTHTHTEQTTRKCYRGKSSLPIFLLRNLEYIAEMLIYLLSWNAARPFKIYSKF